MLLFHKKIKVFLIVIATNWVSLDNNSSSINDSVSVAVTIKSSHVDGRKLTMFDFLIDFMTGIQHL